MFEMTSKKIKSCKKGQKLKKNCRPRGGSNPGPLDCSNFNFSVCARNDSKFWIGNRAVINMINLTKEMVPNLAKLRGNGFFRSNCARNSTRRGLSGPKFHGEYESGQKKFDFLISPISPPSLQPNDWKLAKMAGQKAGHMETMPEISFFEVKKVARCLQMLKTHFHPLKWPNLTENGRNG